MKNILLSVSIFIFACLFLVSCSSGISQEQYKKATDDLTAAQTQIQSLQAQVQSQQNQIQSLQSQTQASQSDKTALTNLQNKISQAKPYWDLWMAFYQIGMTGQEPSGAQILDLMGKIQLTGDNTLSSKWQAVMDSGEGDQEVTDFVDYLFAKMSDLFK
jgi:hypothetical protein